VPISIAIKGLISIAPCWSSDKVKIASMKHRHKISDAAHKREAGYPSK
jgi:hypothetical protein